MDLQTSLRPGTWLAVTAPAGWLLVDARSDDPRVRSAASVLGAGGSADEVLDALLTAGLAQVPAFALVTRTEAALRIVVRGTAVVRLFGADHAEVTCTAPSWHDTTRALSPGTLVLDSGTASETAALLSAPPGAAAAGQVRVAVGEGHPAPPPVGLTAIRRPRLIDGVPGLGRPAAPVSATPRVHTLYCPDGHCSPPFLDRCRVCGAPVPPGEPVEVARPVLGELRGDEVPTVPLTRDALVGRSPRADGLPGEPAPQLVSLTQAGVSRTHLQVVLRDWLVLVRDLGSANGTEMQVPGREPELLRAHEEYVLEPGTTVMLAGEARFTFVVTP